MVKLFFSLFSLCIALLFFSCSSSDLPTTSPLSDPGLFMVHADPSIILSATNQTISNFFSASGSTPIQVGSNSSYNYSIVGTLPMGLSNQDIGYEGFAVLGNPAAGTLGNYLYTIYAEDTYGFKAQKSFSLDVNMIEDSESIGGWSNKSNSSVNTLQYQNRVHVLQGNYALQVVPRMTQALTNDGEALWYYLPAANQDFSSGSGVVRFYYYLTKASDLVVYLVDDAGKYWYNTEEVGKSVSTTNWHSFQKNVSLGSGGFTDGSSGTFNTSSVKAVFILLYESASTKTQVHYSWPFWVDSLYIEN